MGTLLRDTWTVMWREWKALAGWDAGWVTFTSLGAFAALVGVFLPWQVGPAWLDAPWVMLFWAWMPLFLVTTVAADSFAGERERRTLETLLATRLPDRALVAGKVGAAVIWIWGATVLCLPLGVVTVNLAHGGAGVLLYDPYLVVAIAAIAFLAALLGAATGALVSLRVSSVRQAQQVLAIGVMVLLVVPVLGVQLLPGAVSGWVIATLLTGDPARISAVFALALATVDLALLALVTARFQRRRLILD